MGGASRLLMLLATPFPLLYRRSAALRLARHSRIPLAPLSTAASALGCLSSSDPTSRPGFSVRAAEQVHTQAAVFGGPPEHLPASRASHPWPEWSKLVDHLMVGGYSGQRLSAVASFDDDSFAVCEDLPWEFVKAAEACLLYARDRPDVLRLLSRKDVEVVVENGIPFLFKNGANSTRRMRSFLSGDESQVMVTERAQTVDIMRYLLSYACGPLITLEGSSIKATERTEVSVRNLLHQLVNVSGSARDSNFVESDPRGHELRQEQFSRPPGKNIEMKRGDWICLKCSFMNFARNIKCLECNEERPKRQLTGGEWECPQCDFFNYGRNTSCLRCDCKRPEHAPLSTGAPGTTSGYNRNSSFEQILNGINTDKSEIEQRLAANDEKAERWFSKVAQLDNASDLSRAAADEDFPEIMPMRKGENRFVVSTRKTPLERRLANAQNRSSLGIENVASGNDSGGLSGRRSERTSESSISQSLDRILGRTPSSSGTQSAGAQVNDGVGSRLGSSENRQSVANQRKDPDYVPFVPLPADMFSKSKKSDSDMQQGGVKEEPSSASTSQQGDSTYKFSESLGESMVDKESSDVSERWSRKVDELDGVADLTNAISDEAFPEIMPMRKGENRFVVSKKKDRSLTSPQYKRRLAMEQANNSNFVPFVPFPPDYFAKKDKQTETFPITAESSTESSTPQEQVQGVTEKSQGSRSVDFNAEAAGNLSQENSADSIINREFSTKNKSEMGSAYSGRTSESAHAPYNSWNGQKDAWNTGPSQKTSTFSDSSGTGTLPPAPSSGNLQGSRESWKFSGKSLEGSAVKETDPLDMSEEAKAERWFRRVAQIKDISELSQIPDEDFPEIMPMRKGVNRFVVSKRKTPLERRLTSPQYRRNLPIISSEPEKDAS